MSTFTRRKFVATTALAASAAALPMPGVWDGAALAATDVRPNAYSLEGKRMLRLYARGVAAMKTRAIGDPTSWIFQWYTHWVPGPRPTDDRTKIAAIAALPAPQRVAAQAMWNTCQGHGPNQDAGIIYFLPWHRMFVYYFEKIVRSACGDNSFVLPYWDYLAPGQGAIPPEFRDASSALYFENRRPAKDNMRSVNNGEPVPISDETYNCLKLPDYYLSTQTPPNLSTRIDYDPHGLIHDDTGNGNDSNWQKWGMSFVPTAAEDPIFYLHHCNIDRLWASWNAAGHRNPTTQEWLNKPFTFANINGMTLQSNVGAFTDIARLGYSYERLEPVPAAAASAALLATRFKQTPVTLTVGEALSLGASPVQVPLAAPSTTALSAQMKGLPTGSHYYLVIGGLSADNPPGNHYRIYLGAPAGAQGKALARYYVGTPSFFEAVGMSKMPGMAGGSTFTFDVTNIVARIPAKDRDTLQVTLVPTDAPAAGSNPAIAKISLVAD
jgi:tyrosinase